MYLLALGAALLFGLGSVVQQRVASAAPPGKSLRIGLLLWLVRQPKWLAGVGTALVGNLLSGAALGMGSVALVQPLLVTRLLFALPLSAAWARQRLTGRDWLGMLATAGGLGTFIAVARPTASDNTSVPLWQWLVVVAAIGSLTTLLVFLARSQAPGREAPMLGAGAGMLFALQSGFTHTAVKGFLDSGLGALLLNWTTYAVVATAVSGTLLAQSAYEMAPLAASYPTLAAVEPLAGIGIGAGILGSTLVLGLVPVGVFLVALAVMTGGIYLLATSPLVTGRQAEMELRRAEEEEADLDRTIEQDLQRLEAALEWLERCASPGTSPPREKAVAAHLDEVRTLVSRSSSAMARLETVNRETREREAQERAAQPPGDEADSQRHLLERYHAEALQREEELRARAGELHRRAEEQQELAERRRTG